VAIAGRYDITNAFLLTAGAFVLPALVAVPLGALVLRLRGTYFVLVTFVLTQIMQLLLFETPGLTGGSNGISGVPPGTLLGIELASNQLVLLFACGLALLATLITALLTRSFHQHFAAIEENEILAKSLGLVVWRYKALGFVVSAGVAGLAGYSLVNMLLTAHPSSFDSINAVNFIAYTIIGDRASILRPVVGSSLLVYATNLFGTHGQYAQWLLRGADPGGDPDGARRHRSNHRYLAAWKGIRWPAGCSCASRVWPSISAGCLSSRR
jgi:branched-chain amino acid transport system permease protein